jgi:hypothetical protein
MHSIHEARDILTLEDTAQILRVTPDQVLAEVKQGNIWAIHIANEVRIPRDGLLHILTPPDNRASLSAPVVNRTSAAPTRPESAQEVLEFKDSPAFDHKWPSFKGTPDYPEHYDPAYEATIRLPDGRSGYVRIGVTKRESSGKMRERAVVFINGQPMVEFIGADDFLETGLMLAIIKPDGYKHLAPHQSIPSEYSGFEVRPFNELITGPGAKKGLAVVCPRSDLACMARHALIRWRVKTMN